MFVCIFTHHILITNERGKKKRRKKKFDPISDNHASNIFTEKHYLDNIDYELYITNSN